jgi:hypothetical protein
LWRLCLNKALLFKERRPIRTHLEKFWDVTPGKEEDGPSPIDIFRPKRPISRKNLDRKRNVCRDTIQLMENLSSSNGSIPALLAFRNSTHCSEGFVILTEWVATEPVRTGTLRFLQEFENAMFRVKNSFSMDDYGKKLVCATRPGSLGLIGLAILSLGMKSPEA